MRGVRARICEAKNLEPTFCLGEGCATDISPECTGRSDHVHSCELGQAHYEIMGLHGRHGARENAPPLSGRGHEQGSAIAFEIDHTLI